MFGFLKKYWLFILLAALATLLAVLWYQSATQKEEISTPKLPMIDKPALPGRNIGSTSQILINAEPQETTTPLMKITRKPPFSTTEINGMSQALNFAGQPTVVQDVFEGAIYVWVNNALSLTITPNSNGIRLNRDLDLDPLPQAGQFPSLVEAINNFSSIIQKLGLTLPTTNPTQRYIRFNGNVPETSIKEDSEIFELSYSFYLGEFLVVDHDPNMVETKIWFDKNGKVAKFEWQNPIESSGKINEYPAKDISEIIKFIKQEGEIILIGDGSPEMPYPESLSKIDITSIKLGYLLPQQGEILQPIFILTGNAQSMFGSFSTWIYLPAIKEEYFTPTQPEL